MKKSKLITTDDPWGRRKAIRKIYDGIVGKASFDKKTDFEFGIRAIRDFDLMFVAIYNQYLPPAWIEDTGAIKRHVKDIKDVIHQYLSNPPVIWVRKPPDMKTVSVWMFKRAVQQGKPITYGFLPTYLEIEETKQKWQHMKGYRKESEGTSTPLREEVVRLKIWSGSPKRTLKPRI